MQKVQIYYVRRKAEDAESIYDTPEQPLYTPTISRPQDAHGRAMHIQQFSEVECAESGDRIPSLDGAEAIGATTWVTTSGDLVLVSRGELY